MIKFFKGLFGCNGEKPKLNYATYPPPPSIQLVEGSGILPYVYYPEGQTAVKDFILDMDDAMGISQRANYKHKSSPEFNHIQGFKINENITLIRYWGSFYPDHCHRLAKIFGGRIPTEEEFLLIAEKLHEINASLVSIDEPTLYKGHYLVSNNANVYYARTVNIEDTSDRAYADFDEDCCFLVVK